jgi:hypothetical protein
VPVLGFWRRRRSFQGTSHNDELPWGRVMETHRTAFPQPHVAGPPVELGCVQLLGHTGKGEEVTVNLLPPYGARGKSTPSGRSGLSQRTWVRSLTRADRAEAPHAGPAAWRSRRPSCPTACWHSSAKRPGRGPHIMAGTCHAFRGSVADPGFRRQGCARRPMSVRGSPQSARRARSDRGQHEETLRSTRHLAAPEFAPCPGYRNVRHRRVLRSSGGARWPLIRRM